MKIQNINNNNRKQHFGAIVIKGDVSPEDKKLISGLGELLHVKLVGGINKLGEDVLVLDSIAKSQDEKKLHYLIKNMFGNNGIRRQMDKSVEKMKEVYLKKHPDGLQIEEFTATPVNNVFSRGREIQ